MNNLLTSKTKHSDVCARVFNKYDKTCPRCQELAQGSKPRTGWQKNYFENKKKDEAVWRIHLQSQHCNHGIENLNPGGYCTLCGKGVDFS